MIAIRGAAGTGKTTLMQEAVEALREAGHRVRTFAPSSDASRITLRGEGFEDAETLAMLLTSEKVQQSVRGGVIWIDEAGMVGTRDMARLFELSLRLKARIVLSGDYKQHGSVQRGDALRLLVESGAVRAREVTEILRQRGEYKRAIDELSHGRVGEGFQILDQLGAIREVEGDTERIARVADDYLESLARGRNALVVSPSNKEAATVTRAIRERLRAMRALSSNESPVYRQVNRYWGEGTKSDSASYEGGEIVQFVKPAPGFQIGDRIEIQRHDEGEFLSYRFLDGRRAVAPLPLDKPDRFQVYSGTEISVAEGEHIRITQGGTLPNRYRLENGSVHRVKHVTAAGEIELANGVVLPKHWGNFNYAYVSTSYSAQGKTVDDVIVSQSADSFPASSREQFYVSSSRARENLWVYTNSRIELLEAVGASHERLAAIEAEPAEFSAFDTGKDSQSATQSDSVKTQEASHSESMSDPPKFHFEDPEGEIERVLGEDWKERLERRLANNPKLDGHVDEKPRRETEEIVERIVRQEMGLEPDPDGVEIQIAHDAEERREEADRTAAIEGDRGESEEPDVDPSLDPSETGTEQYSTAEIAEAGTRLGDEETVDPSQPESLEDRQKLNTEMHYGGRAELHQPEFEPVPEGESWAESVDPPEVDPQDSAQEEQADLAAAGWEVEHQRNEQAKTEQQQQEEQENREAEVDGGFAEHSTRDEPRVGYAEPGDEPSLVGEPEPDDSPGVGMVAEEGHAGRGCRRSARRPGG